MAMGTRRRHAKQPSMSVATNDLPRQWMVTAPHPSQRWTSGAFETTQVMRPSFDATAGILDYVAWLRKGNSH
jgi:hypothetical protein